jgi:hypothetical protein
MSWYPRILGFDSRGGAAKAHRHPVKAPLRLRPHVEVLEERTLLNNRFVAPVGVPVDNMTTFANLQTALTTPGLATGDTIEIEPGSAPGNVVNANFTTAFGGGVTMLTIQGDPAVGLAGIPQVTISDSTTIAAADTLNLNDANVGLIAAGGLEFVGNTSITGSILADINSSNPFAFAGSSDNLLNSTVVNNAAGADLLDVLTNAGGSSNRISGNTFVSNASTTRLLAYSGGSSVSVTDKVDGNTFVASAGATISNGVLVAESVTGLTIQNNTFSGNMAVAINQSGSTPANLQILSNTVNLSGSTSIGIGLNNDFGSPSTTTSVTVSDNVLNAGASGTGLFITVGAGPLNASIQGNDFHNNQVGVKIVAGSNSIAGVDLGGGSQGSVGGNNFRSFSAAATTSAGAIVTDATTGTIQAQKNIFAVSNPLTVISAASGATVNATALPANAAFVDVLYEDFLKRPGNTSNSSDAGGWVTLLNSGTSPGNVASAILRSKEALGIVVDGLYVKVLGRNSDAAGRAAFVSFLQNGGTIEQAVVGMVTSPEYTALTGSDGGFVESLYVRVLGRGGSSGEVSGWLTMLPTLGRSGVANAIVHSGEFRGDVVQALYGSALAASVSVASLAPDMLHRHASTMEVNGWVNSTFDMATIVVAFASTGEFFTGG